MTKGSTNTPWDRQPRESVQAYEAFSLYLELGSKRSLRRVATELSKSETLIKRWSKNWDWHERSRAYDNELRHIELAEAKNAAKKMQQRQIQTAMLLQKKAVEALDKLDIDELSAVEILKFIVEGAKIEKETRQETMTVEDAVGKTSLADSIINAYKRRVDNE